MKLIKKPVFAKTEGRSPCGERGLKYTANKTWYKCAVSLPVRGAWIEILLQESHLPIKRCRSPCGERGLK